MMGIETWTNAIWAELKLLSSAVPETEMTRIWFVLSLLRWKFDFITRPQVLAKPHKPYLWSFCYAVKGPPRHNKIDILWWNSDSVPFIGKTNSSLHKASCLQIGERSIRTRSTHSVVPLSKHFWALAVQMPVCQEIIGLRVRTLLQELSFFVDPANHILIQIKFIWK